MIEEALNEGMTLEDIEKEFADFESSSGIIDVDGTRTVYCGAFRSMEKTGTKDHDLVEEQTYDWRMEVTLFNDQEKGTEKVFGSDKLTLPKIDKPEPKPDPKDETNKTDTTTDDATKDTETKDTETKDNASFIAATSLTFGAMTAMLAF